MAEAEPQMPQLIVVEKHPPAPVEENDFLPGQDQNNLEVISLHFIFSIYLMLKHITIYNLPHLLSQGCTFT